MGARSSAASEVAPLTPPPSLIEARVTVNRQAAEGLWRMVLLSPELAGALAPGQFINLQVPGDASELLRIPLSSAHADVAAGTVELAYALVGAGTRRLSQVRGGTFLSVVAPCGHGWEAPDGPGRCLLVAGGVGAPPILAACRMLVASGHDCDVVLAARNSERLWGVEALEELGVGYVLVTDDGSAGVRGLATDVLPSLLSAHEYVGAFACGPEAMLAGVARTSDEAHLACQVSLERLMGCGFGACAGCSVDMADGTRRLCCVDGPVFDAREVAW